MTIETVFRKYFFNTGLLTHLSKNYEVIVDNLKKYLSEKYL